jgi:hypothetical protein
MWIFKCSAYNILFGVSFVYACVGIVGGRGTGKTVFFGLLATTVINYSIEAKQHFRFFASPGSMIKISDIVDPLKLRRWPQATLKGSLNEYKFTLGYRKSSIGILKENLVGLFKRPKGLGGYYNKIDFNVYDISGEDAEVISKAARLANERGSSVLEMIPGTLETVLGCDVIVFLIDASKTTVDNTGSEYKDMLEYDGLMAGLASLIAEYRSKKRDVEASKLFFPVIVFSKFDLVDKEVLRVSGIPENLDVWLNSRNRKEIEGRLTKFMKRFYEKTLSQIYGSVLKNAPLENAPMFVSYLMTELSEEGTPVPRVMEERGDASYWLKYSRSEYIRLIEYFGMIADEIKKARKAPEEATSVTGVGR